MSDFTIKLIARVIFFSLFFCFGLTAQGTTAAVSQGAEVYVAGTLDANATLWKKGVPQRLGDSNMGGEARSVFVYNSDIYVAGNIAWKGPGFWKNNVGQGLGSDMGGEVFSIFVSDDRVYAAGVEYMCATIWINGVSERLGGAISSAHSVFVSGKDVYIAGRTSTHGATIWKNSALHDRIIDDGWMDGASLKTGYVPRYLGDKSSSASSVFVSAGNVYVAGEENDRATIWKDNVPQAIGNKNSKANSVFVYGKDVYVAGTENNRATLWKNGSPRILGEGDGSAHSVFVYDGVVYVAGNSGHFATLWKNGASQRLSNKKSDAGSVFVKADKRTQPPQPTQAVTNQTASSLCQKPSGKLITNQPNYKPAWPNVDKLPLGRLYKEEVKVRFVVGPDGSPRDIKAAEGPKELHKSAVDYIGDFRFKIQRDKNGKPCAYAHDVTVTFTADKRSTKRR